MKEFSILLGCGFSIPAGMKSVQDINGFIVNLKEGDFFIAPDQTFILLEGRSTPGFRPNVIEEKFFVALIGWYQKEIESDFNYEQFYDFVISYHWFGTNKPQLETFYNGFISDIGLPISKMDTLGSQILRFIGYFSQVISTLLHYKEFYEDAGTWKYPAYTPFKDFLKNLIDNDVTVHTHTLNHDLLFEHLAKHPHLKDRFTDGYSEFGSPYYGQIHNRAGDLKKTYMVRLKRFIDQFERPLRLYKLHGSIDTYIAHIAHPPDLTRVKKDWGIGEFFKETINQDGKFTYSPIYQNTYPDFLSGISSKSAWYGQPYYKELLDHFKSNLNASDVLLVIGYGFKDEGINSLIEHEFLNRGKKMIILDKQRLSHRLIDFYNPEEIVNSLTQLSHRDWDEILIRIIEN